MLKRTKHFGEIISIYITWFEERNGWLDILWSVSIIPILWLIADYRSAFLDCRISLLSSINFHKSFSGILWHSPQNLLFTLLLCLSKGLQFHGQVCRCRLLDFECLAEACRSLYLHQHILYFWMILFSSSSKSAMICWDDHYKGLAHVTKGVTR